MFDTISILVVLLKNLYSELGVRELANRINPFISFAVLHTEIYLHMPLLSRLHIFSQSELSILFTSNKNVRLRDILYILPKQDYWTNLPMCCMVGIFIIFRDFFSYNFGGRFYANTDVTLSINMCCFTFVIFLPTFYRDFFKIFRRSFLQF